jgi:hypothetical protein
MRSVRLLGVLLCTLFGLNVPNAFANETYFSADCDAVTFGYFNFPWDATVVVHETVIIDGGTAMERDVSITHPPYPLGHPIESKFPISPGSGSHTVYAKATFTADGDYQEWEETLNITCDDACHRGTPNPAGAHSDGDAFGVYVNVLDLIKLPKRPHVSSDENGVGSNGNDDVLATVTLPNVLKLGVMTESSVASVTDASDDSPAEARDLSTSEIANVNLFNGIIRASVIRASAEAIARGDSSAYSSAGSTFANLVINGRRYANVAPNTRVNLPAIPGVIGKGSYVVLHERIATATAPAPDVLAGGTYGASMEVNMIHVYLKGPLLLKKVTEITVAHAYANATFPQTKACRGDIPSNTVSGHAFTASLTVAPNEDVTLINAVVNAVAIEPTGVGSPAYIEAASVDLPGPASIGGQTLGAGVARSSSVGTVTTSASTSSSYANVADLSLFGGMIQAQAIRSQANANADGSGQASDANGTEFLGLVIAGKAYGGTAPPNTTITLPGLGFIVLNEQVPDADAEGHTGMTVRAIHAVVPKLGLDVRVAEAHADATY